MRSAALELRDVDIAYKLRGVECPDVRGVSFRVGHQEAYGLVGESGCGKSTIALATMRYLPRNGRLTAGSIHVDGRDLFAMSVGELRRLRATTISMVYQNPGAALNPSIRIGDQVAEPFALRGMSRRDAQAMAHDMLSKLRIADSASVMRRYPHQLSGGMQQRAIIAMGLAKNPTLLILDEPTTGLDATVEAEILDLVKLLRQDLGTSVLFITHNLAVIAQICDRVGVLYRGRLVEEGETAEVFSRPRHPYTAALLECVPRRGATKAQHRLYSIPGSPPRLTALPVRGCVFAGRCLLTEPVCYEVEPDFTAVGSQHFSRCHFLDRAALAHATAEPVLRLVSPKERRAYLRVEGVSKSFSQAGRRIRALDDVSLHVGGGETLGVVGESGSGKSTFARIVLGLTAPDAGGTLELDGRPLAGRVNKRRSDQVRALQMVFQNPDQTLNRRFSVKRIIGRALTKLLDERGEVRDRHVEDLVNAVQLGGHFLSAKPGQLSGGLKQRVAIARAFAGDPQLVVCDEPTSALDVSVQAAILNLLVELQSEKGVGYVVISHDLGVIRYLADRIAVLYLGRLMEIGEAGQVFSAPHHPYTEALLSALPQVDGAKSERVKLTGDIPSAMDPPSGCVFHTRCPRKLGEICETTEPPLVDEEADHYIRCHIPVDELRELQREVPTGSQSRRAATPAGLRGTRR
jgi:peptide/nickel transport system ATP-binding protein